MYVSHQIIEIHYCGLRSVKRHNFTLMFSDSPNKLIYSKNSPSHLEVYDSRLKYLHAYRFSCYQQNTVDNCIARQQTLLTNSENRSGDNV